MILILTKSLLEINTDMVKDWLSSFNQDCIILTGEELLSSTQMQFSLLQGKETLKVKFNSKEELPLSAVKAVWFRRRTDEIAFEYYYKLNLEKEARQELVKHLKGEFARFYSILPLFLSKAYWLNHPNKSSLNKIAVLISAKECGLTIPETVITNKLDQELKEIVKGNQEYISKPLAETSVINEEETSYSMLTSPVNAKQLIKDEIIFPSLFQQCIDKEFEIRCFYLNGKCFSMAIFSQDDEQTKWDYRNYNEEYQNRCVPYKLPRSIEMSLKKLMQQLKLVAGSIDFIKSKDGTFYFLEVNPVGQFDWVATNCNYQIEKEIAQHLMRKNGNKKKKPALKALEAIH